jgi:putative photosynthetic complex assembly protein 2
MVLEYLQPFGIALLVWWASTGVILFLNHLPAASYRWSMLGATVVLFVALYGATLSSQDTTAFGAFMAFVQGVLVWAWLEMSYFMGFLTGPRKTACPEGCSGWRRFRLAVETSLHHELAIVGFGALLFALTWQDPNRFAAWTYLVLWLMRWSAKLNLFLGVPNINDEWIPTHLRHLSSYIRRRTMNLLFPLSVTLATLVAAALVVQATGAPDAFSRTGLLLVASLLALAVLEHWFLVLPVQDSALWAWALSAAGAKPQRAKSEGVPEKTCVSPGEAGKSPCRPTRANGNRDLEAGQFYECAVINRAKLP